MIIRNAAADDDGDDDDDDDDDDDEDASGAKVLPDIEVSLDDDVCQYGLDSGELETMPAISLRLASWGRVREVITHNQHCFQS